MSAISMALLCALFRKYEKKNMYLFQCTSNGYMECLDLLSKHGLNTFDNGVLSIAFEYNYLATDW